jgi:hypothetical protein
MRLSRQTVSTLSLPPGKSEIIIFDEALPGFGLRIRAGGKRELPAVSLDTVLSREAGGRTAWKVMERR